MKIELTTLSENTFSKTSCGKTYKWDVPTLIQFAKEKKYEIFDLPVKGIDYSVMLWNIENMWDIVDHCSRMKNVDMTIPVLIDNEGTICDGWHRVIRAAVDELETIKAIRLEEMPHASSIKDIT